MHSDIMLAGCENIMCFMEWMFAILLDKFSVSQYAQHNDNLILVLNELLLNKTTQNLVQKM